MSDNSNKAEELLEQSKQQNRHQTDPATDQSEAVDLPGAAADAYELLEEGDLPENLTIRDANLAALFAGLQETGELRTVAKRAQDRLGRSEGKLDKKATALRLLVRVGLEEVAPASMDGGKTGFEQYRNNQEIEF